MLDRISSSEPVTVLPQPSDVKTRKTPVWKRGLDLVLSAVALIFLGPLMLFLAMAVRLTSAGPAVFKQWRIGKGGKPFLIYKFRSMVVEAEELHSGLIHLNEQDGPAFKLDDDPRVTALGRLLRQTGLDELPQLINILRGEMSLVGPRPLWILEGDKLTAWQRRRLEVNPGVTGLWQVRERRVTFDEWMQMDIDYVDNQSLLLDLKIIAATPRVLWLRCLQLLRD